MVNDESNEAYSLAFCKHCSGFGRDPVLLQICWATEGIAELEMGVSLQGFR